MATLHVRNVPEALYGELQRRAESSRRSLSAEVIVLLDAALQPRAEPYSVLIERIRRDREKLERKVGRLASSVELIRADRDR